MTVKLLSTVGLTLERCHCQFTLATPQSPPFPSPFPPLPSPPFPPLPSLPSLPSFLLTELDAQIKEFQTKRLQVQDQDGGKDKVGGGGGRQMEAE